jgi:hypothetical protein
MEALTHSRFWVWGNILGTIYLLLLNSDLAAQSSAPRADNPMRDCRLTLFVREALQQDEQLGQFNLGVEVSSRVATLWGPIPSTALAQRAEEVVRHVVGVAHVRNELRIEPRREPTPELVVRPLQPGDAARSETVAGEGSGMSMALTSRSVNPAEPSLPQPPIVVTLRPPIASESPQLSVVSPVRAPLALAVAIDDLRLADDRFRFLRAEVKGGVVYLHGTAGRWEDVFELAQAVARLSGVERVILKDVQTPRTGTLAIP